jgi:hypothetical protein
VIGVGNSKFGNRSDVTLQELAFEAAKEARADLFSTSMAFFSSISEVTADKA